MLNTTSILILLQHIEDINEHNTRSSFPNFAWPPPRLPPHQQQNWNSYLLNRHWIPRSDFSASFPRTLSQEELMWSMISPSTPLWSDLERDAVGQYMNHIPYMSGERKYVIERSNPKSQFHDIPSNQWWTTEANQVNNFWCEECVGRKEFCDHRINCPQYEPNECHLHPT